MKVTTRIATAEVPEAFDHAAPRYDVMVALNPGYHRHLRSAAEALVQRVGRHRAGDRRRRVVDLGCGSGASTKALVDSLRRTGLPYEVTGVDGSAGMLEQARGKAWPAGVRFEQGLAEDLAADRSGWGLADVDGVLAAYLFRNVTDRGKVLEASYEMLAPGGTLVVQEYSVAGSLGARLVWSAVCWLVVIPLSFLVSRRTRLYRYLWRSVLDFDAVEEFTDRMLQAGFVDVEVRTVPGWQRRILHTFRGRRPGDRP